MGGVPWLTEREERAWRAFLLMHARLASHLHRQLQADSQLSLSDYEVLVALADAPAGRLRPVELLQALHWEQSRLSHHVTRMRRRGLVERRECAEDGRGAFVELTPEGQRAIETAAPGHVAAVRRWFFDHLTAEQVADLERLSDRVLSQLDAPLTGHDEPDRREAKEDSTDDA